MKLHQFFKTLKYQGTIIVVNPSVQIEFMYQKEGKIMMTISLKGGIRKDQTKKIGFEIHEWHDVVDILPTTTAWNIYNNLTNVDKTNVAVRSLNHEIWLEEDEL